MIDDAALGIEHKRVNGRWYVYERTVRYIGPCGAPNSLCEVKAHYQPKKQSGRPKGSKTKARKVKAKSL